MIGLLLMQLCLASIVTPTKDGKGVTIAIAIPTAQSVQPNLPDQIAYAKKSIVPVLVRDTSWPSRRERQGTAVLIGYIDSTGAGWMALTCAHVVAADTDVIGHLTRPASDVSIGATSRDGSTMWVPTEVVRFDSLNDMALCRVKQVPKQVSQLWNLSVIFIPPSDWHGIADLREGDQVLYCGFPMGQGIGGRSFPLSRTGIVSQIVPGERTFLIDGFAQEGHSGSPVFRVRAKENSWELDLVGLVVSYPEEYGRVGKKVGFVPSDTLVASQNPGFTHVVPLDSIFPILEQMGFKRRK